VLTGNAGELTITSDSPDHYLAGYCGKAFLRGSHDGESIDLWLQVNGVAFGSAHGSDNGDHFILSEGCGSFGTECPAVCSRLP
jgi:hypothetical protein